MNYFTIPDHLRAAVNKRRDELLVPGHSWLWFDRQMALGRCVVVSPERMYAVDDPDKQKYLDL